MNGILFKYIYFCEIKLDMMLLILP